MPDDRAVMGRTAELSSPLTPASHPAHAPTQIFAAPAIQREVRAIYSATTVLCLFPAWRRAEQAPAVEEACQAVLLFSNLAGALLLPAVLLLPPKPRQRGGALLCSRAEHWLQGLDAWLERRLRLLVWPAARQQHPQPRWQRRQRSRRAVVCLRWWVVCSAAWRVSAAVAAAALSE